MLRPTALLLTALLLPLCPPAPAAETASPGSPSARVRIPVAADPLAVARDLAARGFDVTWAGPRERAVELVTDRAGVERLRALGFAPELLDGGFGKSPSALSDYMSPAEIEAKLDWYQQTYPGLARRVPYATDHEGRTAWALEISKDVALDLDKPALLFVAQHHAREVMTPEVVMDLVDQLLTNYGSDPEVTRWLDTYEIWALPAHNPDGATYVFTTDSNWRKNRRDNGDGSFGVDLNRNYPFLWNACGGSSGTPGSDTYRGPSPGSEPTTQGLVNLARERRPVYYVTYHTYGQYALTPYGCDDVFMTPPDFQLAREMSNEVSAKMQGDAPHTWFQFGTPWELLYSVDGDSDGWFYGELGSFGLTFELNANAQGFQPDYATWRDGTVARARAGWQYFLRRMDAGRLTGHVTDACSGLALRGATVGLAEQAFHNGEVPRTSDPRFGRFEWPVLPGTYTLQVSNAGYAAQAWPTEVGFAPVVRDVALVPDGSAGAALAGVRVDDAAGDHDGEADPGETVDLFLTAYTTGAAVSGLAAVVTSDDPYVTVESGSALFGDLVAGERREAAADQPVRVRVSAGAPDGHVAALRVAWSATTALCARAEDLRLRVTRGFASCPAILEPLDVDPAWSIDNGTAPGGWQFGPPSGGVGPQAAFTGTNVYGTNLSGNYGDNGRYVLTAGPYDVSGLRHVELRFARWLQSQPGYDIARVEVRAGASGEWQPVWEGFGRDTAWVPVRYDVSRLVDGESELYVRFSLESDGSITRPGFYLDDLAFCGEQLPGSQARVRYKAVRVDDADAAYGNGNGRLDTGETATLVVDVVNSGGAGATHVTGVLTSSTPGITVRNDVADFPDVAAGGVVTSIAPHFSVSVDAACGSTAAFRLTTRWDGGGRATSTFTLPVGQLVETTRLSDDFEAERGWTVGGTATRGVFVRQDPNGFTDPSVGPVQPEDDHTEGAGHVCWVTGNPAVGPGFDPHSGDVDRGNTYIQSPNFDGTGTGRLLLRFARFYHRSGVGYFDSSKYAAEVTTNGGSTWTGVESLETNAAAWTPVEIDLAALVTPTATMRLRFSAVEKSTVSGTDPLTELLIDDVSVVRQAPGCDPFTAPDQRPPNAVGDTLRAARRDADVALSWTAPPPDATHDPARFFPVWRSASPSSGFTHAGEPTSPAWRDADAATPGAVTSFYLVAARNAAGSSGEEPLP